DRLILCRRSVNCFSCSKSAMVRTAEAPFALTGLDWASWRDRPPSPPLGERAGVRGQTRIARIDTDSICAMWLFTWLLHLQRVVFLHGRRLSEDVTGNGAKVRNRERLP